MDTIPTDADSCLGLNSKLCFYLAIVNTPPTFKAACCRMLTITEGLNDMNGFPSSNILFKPWVDYDWIPIRSETSMVPVWEKFHNQNYLFHLHFGLLLVNIRTVRLPGSCEYLVIGGPAHEFICDAPKCNQNFIPPHDLQIEIDSFGKVISCYWWPCNDSNIKISMLRSKY